MTMVSGAESNAFIPTGGYFRLDDDWRSATGKGVSIAIVDSGIYAAHPDLAGRVC